ncbi:hypothetical protein AOQ84DRAFT_93168 [Glonium stellatum]|uniref:Uncharacterized protein n=1 Tax=Glonium stellatum TaxID=574774 RepID=A0A8E2EW39_9PEZI|nr:hypothetical protein AOQ84DRAFT_93168 [Glonium stellatum]
MHIAVGPLIVFIIIVVLSLLTAGFIFKRFLQKHILKNRFLKDFFLNNRFLKKYFLNKQRFEKPVVVIENTYFRTSVHVFALTCYIVGGVLGVVGSILGPAHRVWMVTAQISAQISVQAISLFDCLKQFDVVGVKVNLFWHYAPLATAIPGMIFTGLSALYKVQITFTRDVLLLLQASVSLYYLRESYSLRRTNASSFASLNIPVLLVVVLMLATSAITSLVLAAREGSSFSNTVYVLNLVCLTLLAFLNARWIPKISKILCNYLSSKHKHKEPRAGSESDVSRSELSTSTLARPAAAYKICQFWRDEQLIESEVDYVIDLTKYHIHSIPKATAQLEPFKHSSPSSYPCPPLPYINSDACLANCEAPTKITHQAAHTQSQAHSVPGSSWTRLDRESDGEDMDAARESLGLKQGDNEGDTMTIDNAGAFAKSDLGVRLRLDDSDPRPFRYKPQPGHED